MQTAYATFGARAMRFPPPAASQRSFLPSLTGRSGGRRRVNSAFSRSQESDADDFSYDLLEKTRINNSWPVTAFDKFATMDAGHAKTAGDTPPGSGRSRAQHMRWLVNCRR